MQAHPNDARGCGHVRPPYVASVALKELTFNLNLDEPVRRADITYPPRQFRKTWTRSRLIGVLPPQPVRALDIGAGRHPLALRPQDEVVTTDFDATSSPMVVADISKEWPFEDQSFDLVYMSHVLEHFYPRDRDEVVRRVHRTLRDWGLFVIRVPHRSGFQATGWEHHSTYGLNGVTSLCQGYNPDLPLFRAVSAAVALSLDFDRKPSPLSQLAEWVLNRWWRMTDTYLAALVGGIPEVQFVLQRLPNAVEQRLRQDTTTATAN
jgi:SAM-dependent methyltransferase